MSRITEVSTGINAEISSPLTPQERVSENTQRTLSEGISNTLLNKDCLLSWPWAQSEPQFKCWESWQTSGKELGDFVFPDTQTRRPSFAVCQLIMQGQKVGQQAWYLKNEENYLPVPSSRMVSINVCRHEQSWFFGIKNWETAWAQGCSGLPRLCRVAV